MTPSLRSNYQASLKSIRLILSLMNESFLNTLLVQKNRVFHRWRYFKCTSELLDISAQNKSKHYQKGHIIEFFSEKMTSGNSEAAFLAEAWRTLEKTLLRCWRGSHWLSEVLATLLAAFLAFSELPLGLKSIDLAIKGSKNFGSSPRNFVLHQFTHALTMKGQNIGSSTKKIY